VLTIGKCLEALTGQALEFSGPLVTGAKVDSRKIEPGNVFVAMAGDTTDGHRYIENAFRNGAVAALVHETPEIDCQVIDVTLPTVDVENINFSAPICIKTENSAKALQTIAKFWRKQLNVDVVGITGSVGKSTTKELTADVLSSHFKTLKNAGNLNNEIGLPLSIFELNEEHEIAVLEMGLYVPGEIKFLCDIAAPRIGVITNVGTVHAERAGSQEAIASGKAELVQSLPAAPKGIAILNYDDPFVRPMADLTKAQVFYYGLSKEADLWADDIQGMGLEGIRFRLHYKNDTLHLRVPQIGRHSVHTVLRAVSVGLAYGMPWGEIVHGLQSSTNQIRLNTVYSTKGALILDDTYNASPESTMAALNLLHELDGRKIAILGDMKELGQYEKQGHEKVGMRAASICNELITFGEVSSMIAGAAQQAGLNAKHIHHFNKMDELISFAEELITGKDVVLVKGSNSLNMDRIVSALEGPR
jgi:UDP-N-acetylmuramoyl-tripeptide--D-alanyl-D-alanine ligase